MQTIITTIDDLAKELAAQGDYLWKIDGNKEGYYLWRTLPVAPRIARIYISREMGSRLINGWKAIHGKRGSRRVAHIIACLEKSPDSDKGKQYKEGQTVEFEGDTFVICEVDWYKKGYRSVKATFDGRPFFLGQRCGCAATIKEPGVDLVTEEHFAVCPICRAATPTD